MSQRIKITYHKSLTLKIGQSQITENSFFTDHRHKKLLFTDTVFFLFFVFFLLLFFIIIFISRSDIVYTLNIYARGLSPKFVDKACKITDIKNRYSANKMMCV